MDRPSTTMSDARIQPEASFIAVLPDTFTTTALGTSGNLQLSPSTNTLFQAYATSSATSTSKAEVVPDGIPEFTHSAVWILAGGLSFGFVAAICLFLIEFYPRHSRGGSSSRRRSRSSSVQFQRKKKREYHELPQVDIELDSYGTSRASGTPDWQKSWPLAANEDEEEDVEGEPMLRRRRRRNRKPRNLSVDTSVQYSGLGIAVPDKKPYPSRPESARYAEDSASPSSSISSPQLQLRHWTPLPMTEMAPLTTAREPYYNQPHDEAELAWDEISLSPNSSLPTIRLRSPTMLRKTMNDKRKQSNTSQLQQKRAPDLESGFFEPLIRTKKITPSSGVHADSPPYSTPHGSPNSSRARHSTLSLWLDRGENAIDYVATKLATIMYEQVKNPEEGLLLPVRDCERERKSDGVMVGIS